MEFYKFSAIGRAIIFDLNVWVKWISAFSDTNAYCEEMYILVLACPVQVGDRQKGFCAAPTTPTAPTELTAKEEICVLHIFTNIVVDQIFKVQCSIVHWVTNLIDHGKESRDYVP